MYVEQKLEYIFSTRTEATTAKAKPNYSLGAVLISTP
eukprot:SAG11_NODE_15289_length_583_cov_0.648760_1_plen_36_part_10